MTNLTPRDDVRKMANEILKRVDQLIKAGEIDQAVREIIRAKEIDPANIYVRAYEERLAHLQEEHEKNIARERTRKESEEAARKRDEELRRRRQEEELQRAEEEKRRVEDARRREEERVAEQLATQARAARQAAPKSAGNAANEKIYIDTFKKAWSGGNITSQQALALQQLRGELGISSERQTEIEGQILSELPATAGSETILVVDDDPEMLLLISQMLSYHGYQVTALTTSDEAFELVRKWKPRLILSDINLETSTMGGFSFYEKVRELKHLHEVPFLFLSGLSDDVLIRTGKELGVDDYLTKPISEQNLIATVKGKLKRFSQYHKES